jgi:hypothetical protein
MRSAPASSDGAVLREQAQGRGARPASCRARKSSTAKEARSIASTARPRRPAHRIQALHQLLAGPQHAGGALADPAPTPWWIRLRACCRAGMGRLGRCRPAAVPGCAVGGAGTCARCPACAQFVLHPGQCAQVSRQFVIVS